MNPEQLQGLLMVSWYYHSYQAGAARDAEVRTQGGVHTPEEVTGWLMKTFGDIVCFC